MRYTFTTKMPCTNFGAWFFLYNDDIWYNSYIIKLKKQLTPIDKENDIMDNKCYNPNNEFSINHINNLFDNTNKDGILKINGWYYDDHDESDKIYVCKMDWNEKDRDDFIKFFSDYIKRIDYTSDLVKTIKKINDYYGFEENERADVPKLLHGKNYKFWSTYLEPFKGDFSKDKYGNPIYDESYLKEVKKESKKRLGENDFSYNVIIRSVRLSKLKELNAPSIIIEANIKEVIEALILYKHCKSLTVEKKDN